MMDIPFWETTLGIPFGMFIVNAVIRWFLKLHQSKTADIVLLFLTFDFVVILNQDDFIKFIPNHTLKQQPKIFLGIFLFLIMFNVVFWIGSLLLFEDKLVGKSSHRSYVIIKFLSEHPKIRSLCSLIVSVVSMGSSLAVFKFGA